MTEGTLIKEPRDLRPGDIMFGPIGGLVGVGVALGQVWLGEGFRVGAMSVRHVAIVSHVDTDGICLIEAMPSGARGRFFTVEDWDERHAYARLPEDYPGQAEDAAKVAQHMAFAEIPYSFASYLALGLYRWGVRSDRLTDWINRRQEARPIFLPSLAGSDREYARIALPCEAICSVLVDQAWTLVGKRVMEDTAPQVVTPGALAGRLLTTPGVTWGFPWPRRLPMPARSWVV